MRSPKRVQRGRGDDLPGTTIMHRNVMRKQGSETRKVVNEPYAEAAGFKVYKEEPGGRRNMHGKSKYQ